MSAKTMLIWPPSQVETGKRFQHLARDPRRTRASPEGQLARIGLGIGHQFRHRLGRNGRVRGQRQGDRTDFPDRLETADGIVGHRFQQALVGAMGGVGGDQDRVPVRLGAGDVLRRDHAAGPAEILDHDRLSERFAHMLAEDAGDRVGRAAGGERHDEFDVAAREILRSGRQRQREPCCQNGDERLHGVSSLGYCS
jgi:hypothetical protein